MADLCPETDIGGKALVAAAQAQLAPGEKALRLRSDRAGPDLARALRDMGADVDDRILYCNEAIPHDALPAFDLAFFASGSAVKAFVDRWGAAGFGGKPVAAIGPPTAERLEDAGIRDIVVPDAATVEEAVLALASRLVAHSIEEAQS
jgi:uroporphyrinogen-III synthase